MKEKKPVQDRDFHKNMKEVIIRDFFPELKKTADDETLNKYSLTTYVQTYTSEDDKQFVETIERDRQLLRSTAPTKKVDPELEAKQYQPWREEPFNALFFQPKSIDRIVQQALTYQKKERKPRINYDETRFHDRYGKSTMPDYFTYHPFTTESSTTESESEFEGRSVYRQQLLENPKQIRKDRLEKARRRNELTAKGKLLLEAIKPPD